VPPISIGPRVTARAESVNEVQRAYLRGCPYFLDKLGLFLQISHVKDDWKGF
jgi:hypothetical protein